MMTEKQRAEEVQRLDAAELADKIATHLLVGTEAVNIREFV